MTNWHFLTQSLLGLSERIRILFSLSTIKCSNNFSLGSFSISFIALSLPEIGSSSKRKRITEIGGGSVLKTR